MNVRALIDKLKSGGFDKSIAALYPYSDITERRERIINIAAEFLNLFGDLDVRLFSVPGRTELSGNHTDHNNGRVLAAAVDIDIIAVAAKLDGNTVRLKSFNYREDVIDISSPSADKVKKGSSAAIIAGVADYFAKNGYMYGGFAAYTASDVITGSGLSSSAAFEVLCGRIFSEFYNDGKVPLQTLAKAGKYAENEFFGKPCGLMDQTACALGGCLWMDFENGNEPTTQKIDFDIERHGYSLCIVNTGGSHSDLTDDYASITSEMRSVALLMGKKSLRLCDEADFMRRIPYIRTLVGDRACMRAIHYFSENRRVDLQKNALVNNNFDEYLHLVSESGNSSYKYLQNTYSIKDTKEQGISLALALTEDFGAVCRVHGGGFAGTIQAYVENDRVGDYKKMIESVFGENSCNVFKIRQYGASVIEENTIKG